MRSSFAPILSAATCSPIGSCTRAGQSETMLMGAATVASLIRQLCPGAEIQFRERLSQLTYAGPKKVTRLPRRSAVVAFSADAVYAIAERLLIRRQRGGALRRSSFRPRA